MTILVTLAICFPFIMAGVLVLYATFMPSDGGDYRSEHGDKL